MSFSEKLNQSIQYTSNIFHRLGELLILFIISIIPIVNFIALGYYARVARDNSISSSAPKVERYTDMFVEGLKIVVVGLIWGIIIAIVASIIAIPFLAVAAVDLFTNVGSYLSAGWIFAFGSFFAVFGIIAFLIGIFAFMGIIHMVKNNSFGKAFAFGEIFSMIGKIGWLRYLAFFVVFFVVTVVLSILTGWLGPVGWIIEAFLSVPVGIWAARTIGLLYDAAAGTTPTPVVM